MCIIMKEGGIIHEVADQEQWDWQKNLAIFSILYLCQNLQPKILQTVKMTAWESFSTTQYPLIFFTGQVRKHSLAKWGNPFSSGEEILVNYVVSLFRQLEKLFWPSEEIFFGPVRKPFLAKWGNALHPFFGEETNFGQPRKSFLAKSGSLFWPYEKFRLPSMET